MGRAITRHGIRLTQVRDEPGWWTEDGRFHLYTDDSFTYTCEGPHPVRLARRTVDDIRRLADDGRRFAAESTYGMEAVSAVLDRGRAGYRCDGDQTHQRTEWCVWETRADDYLRREAGGYMTLNEAVQDVAERYEEERRQFA